MDGEERNHTVLVTAQNQSTLRGFDVTGAEDMTVKSIKTAWNRIASRNMTLDKKEASVVKNATTPNFKTFKTDRIRYFHKN